MNLINKKLNIVYLSIIVALLTIFIATNFFISTASTSNVAQSEVISNADVIKNDLLLKKSNRSTETDGKVFNSNALSELYYKLTGNINATFDDVESNARNVTTKDYSDSNVKTMHSGMDSEEIRAVNNGANIIVKLDGQEWIVTALSTKDNSDNSDVILTLLLKEKAYNSKWGAWAPSTTTDFSGNYPPSMYSASYIRSGLLNGAVDYASSKSALKSLSDSDKDSLYGADGYPFSIYTDSSAQGSITNFLVKPNEVLYQQNENFRDASGGVRNTGPNENAKNQLAGSKWESSSSGAVLVQNKETYFDWGNDLIWLPSVSETGHAKHSSYGAVAGLWNLDAQQRGTADNTVCWLRSAGSSVCYNAFYLDAVGAYNTTKVTSSTVAAASGTKGGTFAVRPAMHINLTLAESSSGILLEKPVDVSTQYTSELISIDSLSKLPDWYDAEIYEEIGAVTTVYKEKNTGDSITGGVPKNTGEYTVEFTIKSQYADKYAWSDNVTDSSLKRSITFKINAKPIRFEIQGGGSTLPVVEHIEEDLGINDKNIDQGKVLGFRFTSKYGSEEDEDYYDDTKPPVIDGIYYATVISLNDNYVPDPSLTQRIEFKVEGEKVNIPKFTVDEQEYDGGNNIMFLFDENFDATKMHVVEASLQNGVTMSGAQIINVTKAGEYTIKVALNNKDNSIFWNSHAGENDIEDKEIKFKVTPAQISVQIESVDGKIKVERGNKIKINGFIFQQPIMAYNNDVVNLKFWADYGAYKCEIGSCNADVGNSTFSIDEFELNTDKIPQNGSWKLRIESDNTDYAAVLKEDVIFEVTNKVIVTSPTWILKRNGARVGTATAVLGDTAPLIYSQKYEYNVRNQYEWSILAPNFTVDTSYGTNGYLTVAGKGASNTAIGKNADTYTTSVRLKDSEGNLTIYSIEWTIDPVKYDLSDVKWLYDGQLPYDKINGSQAVLDEKTLPDGLIAHYINNAGTMVGDSGSASVTFKLDTAYDGNYILPDENDSTTYVDKDGDFAWSKTWTIVKATILSSSWKNSSATDSNNHAFDVPILRDPNADGGIVEYEYYLTDSMGKIIDDTPKSITDILWSESEAKFYIAKPVLQDTQNYQFDVIDAQSKVFRVGKDLIKVQVSLESASMEYNTNPRHAKAVVANGTLPNTAFELTYYDGYTKLATAPSEVGKYRVEVCLKASYIDRYQIDGDYEFDYEITKAQIAIEWNTNAKPNVLNLKYGQINGIEYELTDAEGNVVAYNELKAGNTYKIRAKIKDSQLNNFVFADGTIETAWQEFGITASDKLLDPNKPSNPSYPQVDPDLPTTDPDDDKTPSGNIPSGDGTGSGNGNGAGSINIDNIGKAIKDNWQPILALISMVFILIFTSKGISYASKRKRIKKTIERKYSAYYAITGIGLFKIPNLTWTIVAGIMAGVAVLSLVFMLLEKKMYITAEDELDDAKDEYERKKEENMRMLLMGGNGQPSYAYAPQGGMGAEDMRLMINEAVTALLPNVQQMLPQQASSNDEVVQKLMEQNAQNEERMRQMSQENEERIEKLMKQLAKQQQQSVEKAVTKEAAPATISDEAIEKLASKLQPVDRMPVTIDEQTLKVITQNNGISNDTILKVVEKTESNDETIKRILENQDKLIAQMLELSKDKSQPQVIEKVVEVPVEVEKIVEKEVKVEVPVEKVVEKEVVKEVKVPVVAAVPTKPKKEVAPRLTLDEAYAQLPKQQQKYFDGLREYALSKEKCKEKRTTYAIVIGQSTVNPLIKLTIKKNMTVALFKMEDEYLKDIKRDATSDGTKVKVKETEVEISDAQACKTAKHMIDLREDQIERYQELLREQKALGKRK